MFFFCHNHWDNKNETGLRRSAFVYNVNVPTGHETAERAELAKNAEIQTLIGKYEATKEEERILKETLATNLATDALPRADPSDTTDYYAGATASGLASRIN